MKISIYKKEIFIKFSNLRRRTADQSNDCSYQLNNMKYLWPSERHYPSQRARTAERAKFRSISHALEIDVKFIGGNELFSMKVSKYNNNLKYSSIR